MRGIRTGTSSRACVLLALVMLCACSGAGQAERRAHARVATSFGQLSSQVGSTQGLLRVVNTGHTDLVVSGVGLDWPSYGPRFVTPKDRVLSPGDTVDFPVRLPEPRCEERPGGVVGLVDTGDSVLRRELDPAGRRLLRRVRRQACEEQFVAARVGIGYGRSWRLVGSGHAASVVGRLRLIRRDGDATIRPLGGEGSVLYDLRLPGAAGLAPGADRADVPLRIEPGNRCDDHARSQVTAPFAFRLSLLVGTRQVAVAIPPPPDVQARVTALLERACGG